MSDPTRLHVALNVADLDAAQRFYTDLFGAGPDKVRPGYARFTPADTPLVLSLNPAERVEPGNAVAHLGVRVGQRAQYEETHARLRAAGYDLREQPQVHCCHSIQDKFWVHDPDGNEWEVYELLDDEPEATNAKGKSCCG